jgi:Fe-S-cluster containining protein
LAITLIFEVEGFMSAKNESKRQGNFFDTCSQCKTSWSCCHETTPPVTDTRRKIIDAFLAENNIRIKNPFVKTDYVFPRLDKDGYCVFHDKKTRKCLVHAVKPETCVAGPITFDINVRTGKIEWFIKMKKICALAGLVRQDSIMLQIHLGSAKKEISRLVKELDSGALSAILKKDEPETLKIDENTIGENVTSKIARD